MGVFDLVDENFQLVDIPAQVSGYYIGGAAPAANGKITLAPYVAIGVGVFDPADESFQLTDISAQLSGDYKFSGAAPLPMARSSLRPMPPMVWASSFLSMRPLAHQHLRAFERRLQVLYKSSLSPVSSTGDRRGLRLLPPFLRALVFRAARVLLAAEMPPLRALADRDDTSAKPVPDLPPNCCQACA